MDRGEVGLVVRTTSEGRDDVVNRVSSGLLADVADASVALQHPCSEAFPVWRKWSAAVSSHALIVPQDVVLSVRQVVTGVARRDA